MPPAEPREEIAAPRTYQSAWQFGENGTAVLLTAEEWLGEEAYVESSLDEPEIGPDRLDDTGPKRHGILRAIAKEIAALRSERTLWAEAYTKLRAEHDASLGSLLDRVETAEMNALVCADCGKTMGQHFDMKGRVGVGAWCYTDGSVRHFRRAEPRSEGTPEGTPQQQEPQQKR